MTDHVSRAEFEELRRQLDYLKQGFQSGRRLTLPLGDRDVAPGIFALQSPDFSSDAASQPKAPGLVYVDGRWHETDGTTARRLLRDGDINIAGLDARSVGGLTADTIRELVAAGGIVTGFIFNWNDASGYKKLTVPNPWGAYGPAATGWCLHGTDQLPVSFARAQLVIRYTAVVNTPGETWDFRIYDATDTQAIIQITGLVAGANLLGSSTTLLGWPATAASNVSIQAQHSTGAAGNTFQLHALSLLVRSD